MVRDLYLAPDIQSLEKMVFNTDDTSKRLGKSKPDFMRKTADRLRTFINADEADEEKTYVLMVRYLKLTDTIYAAEGDKQFFDIKFKHSIKNIKKKASLLREKLIERYENEKKRSNIEVPVEIVPVEEERKPLFGSNIFITSKELYNAFDMDGENILVMDVRPKDDYAESHLKCSNIINISEEYIANGLSAHVLGSKLPNDVKQIYDKRGTFEYIVLVDRDTTSNNLMSSKLHTFRNILVMWDLNTIYKHSPNILSGGYMDFIDLYPTLTTNPHIILSQKYTDLDDLLNLDSIQYPTEITTSTAYVQIKPSTKPELSGNEIMDDMCNIAGKQLKIEIDLLNSQTKLVDLEKHLTNVENYDEYIILMEKKEKLSGEVSELETAKIIQDERKNIRIKQLQSLQSSHLLDKKPLDEKKAKYDVTELKIAETAIKRKKLIEEYERSLDRGGAIERPKKCVEQPNVPPPADDTNIIPRNPPAAKPTVNRTTKPQTLDIGLNGLVNIRNTCYMNSVIQCFRHIPLVKDFFCQGIYNDSIRKKKPEIIYETAQLVRSLWTGTNNKIRPMEFYNKIGVLNPIFQNGQHEDCMEFFLLLLNNLSDDCSADVVSKGKYVSSIHQAWLYKLGDRVSYFNENFYHLIKVSYLCNNCDRRCEKYDLESMFMLCLPDVPECFVSELLEDYMSANDMIAYACQKCDVDVKIEKEFSYQPKIIVIVLKRYKLKDGIIQRINNMCHFPVENFKIGYGTYKLWSVALHQGSTNSGHYTAACRNPYDGEWYEYNDDTVRLLDINSDMPKLRAYQLFYQLVDDDKSFGFH